MTARDRATYVYGRGDYNAEYAADLVEHVEVRNCVKGCALAGTRADREEFGPGGNCVHLAGLFAEIPVPEFDPRPDGIHCDARVDPATVGMEPLFEVPS